MIWKKNGLIFTPDGNFDWNKSHAQVPVVDMIDEKKWRIYFASRNLNNISNTSYIDVEAGNPENILYIHNKPILELGSLGTFDEHGIMPSCIITLNSGVKYLYYIGWSMKQSVPYQNSIGLAISLDNGNTFRKYSQGPIIGVNEIDPFFTGTIFVFKEYDLFRAYYLSCIGWRMVNQKPEPLYIIKYATSKNGINWQRDNKIAISFDSEKEGGLVSASVLKKSHKYYMWFGYRNYFDFRTNPENSYKIGFAVSFDGEYWIRDDNKSGISVSAEGWDSEMISYPFIVEFKEKLFMFYNGNQFGKSGFGYAVCNESF